MTDTIKPDAKPEGTVLRRWYEVRIVERTEVVSSEKEWHAEIRDYAYSPGVKTLEVTRFEQRAEVVDIRRVICAVNGLLSPEDQTFLKPNGVPLRGIDGY